MKFILLPLFVTSGATLEAQNVNCTYHQAGSLSTVVYPNGITATHAYDAFLLRIALPIYPKLVLPVRARQASSQSGLTV